MDGTVTSDQIMYVDGIGVTLASEFRADGMPEPSALGMMALALLVGLGFIRNTGPGS